MGHLLDGMVEVARQQRTCSPVQEMDEVEDNSGAIARQGRSWWLVRCTMTRASIIWCKNCGACGAQDLACGIWTQTYHTTVYTDEIAGFLSTIQVLYNHVKMSDGPSIFMEIHH